MAYAWEVCNRKNKRRLAWDEVGLDLLEHAVKEMSLVKHMLPAIAFCPLPGNLWHVVLEPGRRFRFEASLTGFTCGTSFGGARATLWMQTTLRVAFMSNSRRCTC
jgi:hypothetical protein